MLVAQTAFYDVPGVLDDAAKRRGGAGRSSYNTRRYSTNGATRVMGGGWYGAVAGDLLASLNT